MEPWRPATHYATLGVGRDATDDQLKKQYKLLAKHHHPDRNRGDEAAAAERFKAVHEAYTTLSDAAARREYDAELRQKMAQQVAARRIGQVVATEIRTNRVANFSYRFGRNIDAVCPHIGDEAGHFAVNLHPFIESLGDLHGAAGRIDQLT